MICLPAVSNLVSYFYLYSSQDKNFIMSRSLHHLFPLPLSVLPEIAMIGSFTLFSDHSIELIKIPVPNPLFSLSYLKSFQYSSGTENYIQPEKLALTLLKFIIFVISISLSLLDAITLSTSRLNKQKEVIQLCPSPCQLS